MYKLFLYGSSSLTVLALTTGCTMETGLHSMLPTYEDRMCDPEPEFTTPNAGTDLRGGAAVALAIMGSDRFNENEYAVLGIGAPGSELDVPDGSVTLQMLDRATGNPTSDPTWTLTPPTSGGPPLGARGMGWSLQAMDLAQCRPYGGAFWSGCGQELLVGAPGDSSMTVPGSVLIYESLDLSDTFHLQLLGYVQAPSPDPADQFGFALAVASRALDPMVPFDPNPAPFAPWVAVGAPGTDSVHLFAPSSGSPALVPVQTITAPSAGVGHGFGKALAVGHFDSDPFLDLAVGAPDPTGGSSAVSQGQVFIFGGTPSGVSPTPRVILDAGALGPAQIDGFGHAMDAGDFLWHTSGDELAIGAPFYDDGAATDTGAMCFVSFDAVGVPSSRCQPNPYLGVEEEYGYSVAVLNAEAIDAQGSERTAEAFQKEIAVGLPGYHGDEGVVMIHRTGNTRIDVMDNITMLTADTPAPGERFGDVLGHGYVSHSPWEDTLVGVPSADGSRGEATVTRANDLLSCSGGASHPVGFYTSTDHAGNAVGVKVWVDPSAGLTHLALLDDMTLALTDTGSTCTYKDGGDRHDARFVFPADSEIVLHDSWSCGTTTQDYVGEALFIQYGLSWSFDVTLNLTTSSGGPDKLEIEVGLDDLPWDALSLKGLDSDCIMEPIEGVRSSEQACEM